MPQVSTAQSQPVLLSISQVAQTLGLSRSKVYQLISYEGLPTVRFGRAVRVRYAALLKWVEQREEVE